jgi:chemotaxis protein MotB
MAEGRRPIIKKNSGGHAHHGGAWKVAYADFVTAMMALFMVMWLLASTDQQSRQEISRYFRTGILPEGDMAMDRAAQKKPSVVEEASAPAKRGAAGSGEDARELGNAIERMVKSDPELAKLAAQVSISITEEGVLIEAVDRDGSSMLFDSASSELKPALVAFLDKLGPMLADRGNKIRVMGHTDARPYVSRAGKTNWDLSYERASNARRVLETTGIARGQITAVQAHGASQLRNSSDPFAAENRRLSVLVLHAPMVETDESTPAK